MKMCVCGGAGYRLEHVRLSDESSLLTQRIKATIPRHIYRDRAYMHAEGFNAFAAAHCIKFELVHVLST